MTFDAVEYFRPVSHVARWARWASLVSLFLFIGSWAALRFGPLLQPNFIALYVVACVLASFGIIGGLIGLISLWRVGAQGGKASVAALLVSIPVLAPGAYAAWLYHKAPLLYEVSTDLVDPPQWIRAPAYDQMWLGYRPPAGPTMRNKQSLAYPALIGHRYGGALDHVLAGARAAAKDMHVKIRLVRLPKETVVEPGPLAPGAIPIPTMRPDRYGPSQPPPPPPVAYLQGEVVGMVTGFPYDIVIRLNEDGDATLADIRVSARYGRTDLGGSARIADTFMKTLDTDLAGASSD